MGRRLALVLALAAAPAHVLGPASAQAGSDTHYQDTLVGERAAGMGGAYVAIASEATGAYYNPAGIAVDASTLIQLSMSAYKLRFKRVRVLDLCGTVLEDDRSAAFSFPASLGFVKILSSGEVRHALGFTLTVPFADRSGQAVVERNAACGESSLDIGIANALVDRVLAGGMTYAVRLLPWLQLGATAGVSVRGLSSTLLVSVLERSPASAGDHPSVSFANIDVNLWNGYAQVGLIAELASGIRAGFTATTPYFPIHAGGTLDVAEASGLEGDLESTRIRLLGDAEFSWKVPASIAAGVAWVEPGRWTLALDVRIHAPVERYRLVEHERLDPERVPMIEREAVVNVAAGGELFLSERWIVRAGLFTNRSSFPQPEATAARDRDRVHLLGATLGVSFASDEHSLLSLAIQGQWGTGDVLTSRIAVDPATGGVVAESSLGESSESQLLVTFGGSFDVH